MDTVRSRRWLLTLVLPVCLLVAAVANAAAAPAVELPQLDIPYTKHVLANGLTLIVHEDHKTAQVTVDINYRVGTGDEPPGVTGISHLFEHLMFRGSEHNKRDWFQSLQPLGGTAGTANGMAYVDRTHYFSTVASGALDAILWLESDRMGYLLGAMDQATLDEQRGIVHNERRSVENTPWQKIGSNPYGPNAARILEAIWPPGHPYSHLYIGSAEDLDSVTLDGLKAWFRKWYTPSNAVLTISGDVTAAEAKSKVEHYFGALSPGPSITRVHRWEQPMPGKRRDVMYDSQLATAALARVWSIPDAGLGAADADYLELLATILSQPTSRLSRRLIVEQKLASDFAIDVRKNEIGSQVTLRLTAMPGVDLAPIERVVDEELARTLKEGPSADELQIARMSKLAEMVSSVQSTGFKAHLLGKHELFLGNADAWKISFERLKTAKPADLTAAGQRWLQKGNYTLSMLPRAQLKAATQDADRSRGVPSARVAEVQAPRFERTKLPNGAQVLFAQRQDAPEVTVNLLIPIGASASDQTFPAGIAELVMDLSLAGTDKHTGTELAQALGKLGASLKVSSDEDAVQLSLKTLSTSFPEAMTLFADVLLRPAFGEAELERLKARHRSLQANATSNAISAADWFGPQLLFGPTHPYGRLRDDRSIAAVSRADVQRFHRSWIRPDQATLVVVGDIARPKLEAQLQSLLGAWQAGGVAPGAAPASVAPAKSTLWLIDAPGASQSSVQLVLPAPAHAREREPALQLLTRLMGQRLGENLRNDKHWTYGVASTMSNRVGARWWRVQALVQTDKTAPAMAEMRKELARLASDPSVVAKALPGLQQERVRGLANSWETHEEVATALGEIALHRLPDDYLLSYSRRIESVTPLVVSRLAAELLANRGETWIVAGDLAKIRAELDALGIGEAKVIEAARGASL